MLMLFEIGKNAVRSSSPFNVVGETMLDDVTLHNVR